MSDLTPPGPPPGPPMPASAPPQAAMGLVRLTVQGSAFTSSMITPSVSINGYRVQAKYGENLIPVYAGPTRVDVTCQWLKEYGQATAETTVAPGQHVALWYAAPFHQFARGAIGFEPQKRPGLVVLVGIIAVLVLVALLLVVLPNL